MNKKDSKKLKKHMKDNHLKPFIADGGCKPVKVARKALLKTLEIASENQREMMRKAGLYKFNKEADEYLTALYESLGCKKCSTEI